MAILLCIIASVSLKCFCMVTCCAIVTVTSSSWNASQYKHSFINHKTKTGYFYFSRSLLVRDADRRHKEAVEKLKGNKFVLLCFWCPWDKYRASVVLSNSNIQLSLLPVLHGMKKQRILCVCRLVPRGTWTTTTQLDTGTEAANEQFSQSHDGTWDEQALSRVAKTAHARVLKQEYTHSFKKGRGVLEGLSIHYSMHDNNFVYCIILFHNPGGESTLVV